MENFTNLGMTEVAIVAIMALLLVGFIWLGVRIPNHISEEKSYYLRVNNNSTFYSLNDFISYYPNTL